MRADAAVNRARVLEAAAAVFGEQGVEASTEEVARRAGVGVGTVFRHFPTKRELVEATLVAHFEDLAATVATLEEQHVAAFRTLTMLLYEMAESGPTKFALVSHLVEGGVLPEPARDASNALRAAVDRVLRRARDDGAVRPDVGVDEVYHLLRGLAHASSSTPDAAVRRRAVEIVVAGLTAPT